MDGSATGGDCWVTGDRLPLIITRSGQPVARLVPIKETGPYSVSTRGASSSLTTSTIRSTRSCYARSRVAVLPPHRPGPVRPRAVCAGATRRLDVGDRRLGEPPRGKLGFFWKEYPKRPNGYRHLVGSPVSAGPKPSTTKLPSKSRAVAMVAVQSAPAPGGRRATSASQDGEGRHPPRQPDPNARGNGPTDTAQRPRTGASAAISTTRRGDRYRGDNGWTGRARAGGRTDACARRPGLRPAINAIAGSMPARDARRSGAAGDLSPSTRKRAARPRNEQLGNLALGRRP